MSSNNKQTDACVVTAMQEGECSADISRNVNVEHREEPQVENEGSDSMYFEVCMEKTDKGFGIYFAKRSSDEGKIDPLVVDGFVEDEQQVNDGDNGTMRILNDDIREKLQLGDILTAVNDINCEGMEALDIIGILRSAAIGQNTLHFRRLLTTKDSTDDVVADQDKHDVTASIKVSFIGALMKVKSKIKAEIEGDEMELLQEQEEEELFKKQWLQEFDRLRVEQQTKWETCSYSADEFCGLLYHSSDDQQKQYLLQEYPTLMKAWEDVNLNSSFLRFRPDWPAAKVVYREPVEYPPRYSPVVDNLPYPLLATRKPIHSSPSLARVLQCLRTELMWQRTDVQSFVERLEEAKISSCIELLAALEIKGSHFERRFQSQAYPRITKAVCRVLHEQAVNAEKNMNNVCIDSLTFIPQVFCTARGTEHLGNKGYTHPFPES